MAISLVQQKDSGLMYKATTLAESITLDSAPTEGNLLVVCAVLGSTISDTTISGTGWIEVGSYTYLYVRLKMWYKLAEPDEPSTITVTTASYSHKALWVAEYSGTNLALDVSAHSEGQGASGWYSGITPDPNFKDGLYLAFLGYMDSVRSATYRWDGQAEIHPAGLVQTGGAFAHRTSSRDTRKVLGRVYTLISSGGEQNPCDAGAGTGSTGDLGGGIVAIFAESGATPADPHLSGTAQITRTQAANNTNGLGGATTVTLAFLNNPTSGNLLIAGLAYPDVTGTVTSPPPGWAQLGTYVDAYQSSASRCRLSIWYKIAGPGESNEHTWTLNTTLQAAVVGAEYAGVGDVTFTPMLAHPISYDIIWSGSGATHPYIGSLKTQLASTGDTVGLAWFAGGASSGVDLRVDATDNNWISVAYNASNGVVIQMLEVFGNVNTHISCRFLPSVPTSPISPIVAAMTAVGGAGGEAPQEAVPVLSLRLKKITVSELPFQLHTRML